ncbi:hypothetical protein [Anoxybacillus kestanbolensis]|uniref:hypothetical protein n=1 Tax=Anoxybacillus kestanbolensis TaxID=227476 RepID=UPI003D1D214A
MLVITGEGEDAFCAGGDLQVFHQLKTKEEAHAQTITQKKKRMRKRSQRKKRSASVLCIVFFMTRCANNVKKS